jgi:low affinity Fe/Cu permease
MKIKENVRGTLETANPVLKIEQNQEQIIDENKTHFYFTF